METIILQVLVLAMFATTVLALPSIKHKFLCDWDFIIEEPNTDKCKPYAAQSADKTEQTTQAIQVVPSKPSDGTEQCACFFQCSMIIVGILTFFALLALLIATFVAGCQMMMAVK